jgi:alkanesulfonate monooxygenase SsuD/methylene tetrahydromethanopterin reductase-like flavin-dependent oxidoreductase (luciferase family)
VIGTAPVFESLTTLSYAAAVTKRLRFGIAVLLIAQPNPIDLAKSLSSIDARSNGRLIVGVGLARAADTIRLMDSQPSVSHAAVDRRSSNAEGTLFAADNISTEPKPAQKPRPTSAGMPRASSPEFQATRGSRAPALGAGEFFDEISLRCFA